MAQPAVPPGGPRAYRLLAEVGSGGFGTVHRAELHGAAGFRKTVAIKVLRGDHPDDDSEVGRRLRDEARILGLLQHPAIVGVDDLVRIDGRWAVVMEYVDGVDLRRILDGERLSTRIACEIVREVLLALDAAHRAVDPGSGAPLRIVHRDVKPSNIRITAAGRVKVLDFGVASARFARREAHTGRLRMGSPGYVAPERFDGVDSPAADVFSVGAVFYECVSGQRLGPLPMGGAGFAAKVLEALDLIADARVREVTERLLAYEPVARPAASEAASLLRSLALEAEGPWLTDWAPDAVRRGGPPEAPPPWGGGDDSTDGGDGRPGALPTAVPATAWTASALSSPTVTVSTLVPAGAGAGSEPLVGRRSRWIRVAAPLLCIGAAGAAALWWAWPPAVDPAAPEDPSGGDVRVANVGGARLVDGAGRVHEPGRVPAGRYRLEYWWDDARVLTYPGAVEVTAGGEVVLTCSRDNENCWVPGAE